MHRIGLEKALLLDKKTGVASMSVEEGYPGWRCALCLSVLLPCLVKPLAMMPLKETTS